MPHPEPQRARLSQQGESPEKLIADISKLKDHKNFAQVYERFKPKFLSIRHEERYLQCLHAYLTLDHDNDGIRDWKIASTQQLYSHLLPLDEDWDNDGVTNLFDAQPLVRTKKTQTRAIPNHLRLSHSKNSKLNQLQDQILSSCNVLTLNHTDDHDESMLKFFLDVCKPALAAFKGSPYNFILYAFSSHATAGNIIASFYAESNYMSIGGKRLDVTEGDAEKTKLTIAHEIGHYLTFNVLTPKELAEAAGKFGDWHFSAETPTSFFDPRFLLPAVTTKGFFPSVYSQTNIHEWFSEVFANFLYRKLKPQSSAVATNIPPDFESWMSDKFQF